MNTMDLLILAVLAFSVLVSLTRGFVREVMSLAGWAAAFFVASRGYTIVSAFLTVEPAYLRDLIGAGVLFVGTLLVCAVVNFFAGQLVDKTGLSGTDRVLGAVFGIVRGALVVAAALFFLDSFTPMSKELWWKESQLIPHFGFIIQWFFEQLQSNSSFLGESAAPATSGTLF